MKKFAVMISVVTIIMGLIVPLAFAGTTEIASVNSEGLQSNNWSGGVFISADGRFVAFSSRADNLVPGDTNGTADVFVHDRETGITERVNVSSQGAQANRSSGIGSISADGRFVSFYSDADNLDPACSGCATKNIYVHDRETGSTEIVSVRSNGDADNGAWWYSSISADGRYVAFNTTLDHTVPNDTNGATDVFVRDRQTGTTEIVSISNSGIIGNGDSYRVSISYDGRFVAFISDANNLVPDDTNGRSDVFVYDRTAKTIERVSVNSEGIQGNSICDYPSISADGRYVAFESYSSNLVPEDWNGKNDVFVRDRITGVTERVNISSIGDQANCCNYYQYASISGDGRHVAFMSGASNLVPGDTNGTHDIFLHDRTNHTTERVSVNSDGTQGNEISWTPSISDDGRYVAFTSHASNLVLNDTNENGDIFVHDRYDDDGDGFAYYDECNDNDSSIYPDAPEIKHDGIDQDCNGYDLTIDITKANYEAATDTLRVEATSSLAAAADLNLIGHGGMTWKDNQQRWEITVESIGGDPGEVQICGIEGCESAQITVE